MAADLEQLRFCLAVSFHHTVSVWMGKKVLPGRIAETGNIRWPMNFPPSSYTASLKQAREGKTTCKATFGAVLTFSSESSSSFHRLHRTHAKIYLVTERKKKRQQK